MSRWATYFVEVDVHALELEVRRAVVDTGAVEAMLARDGLPEGGTNLVTLQRWLAAVCVVLARAATYALTGLEVNLWARNVVSCLVCVQSGVVPEGGSGAGMRHGLQTARAPGIRTISRMMAAGEDRGVQKW